MMVVTGEADVMLYLDSWTHKWDTCAGEAIVKAMGGWFMTSSRKEIVYDP